MRRTFENVYGYYESELTKNVRDWKELFDYGPKPRPDLPDNAPENTTLDGHNQWPKAPPGFRWGALYMSCDSCRMCIGLLHCQSLLACMASLCPSFEIRGWGLLSRLGDLELGGSWC